MDIRTELENVVKIRQSTKENDYEYTVRLAETVDRETSDDAFNALSDDAKKWMNTAITSYKTRKKLPDLPQSSTTEVEAPKTEAPVPVSPTTKEELSIRVIQDLASELKPTPTPKKEKVKKVVDEASSSSGIREIICQNYTLPLAQIEKLLTERNIPFKPSLVRNVYAYVVSTIKTLNELGLLKQGIVKGASDSAKLRELICNNSGLGVSEIQKLVVERGINCNSATVSVIYYHIKATLKTLRTAKMID